jgi:hypothetical protein
VDLGPPVRVRGAPGEGAGDATDGAPAGETVFPGPGAVDLLEGLAALIVPGR